MAWKSLLCLEKDMKICLFHLINIGEDTPPLVCVCVRVCTCSYGALGAQKSHSAICYFLPLMGFLNSKLHTQTLSHRLLAISCVRGDIIKPHYVRYEPPYSPITESFCVCGVRVCACTCVMRRAYSICWEKERLRYTCTLRVLVWCVSETQISTDQTDETETNKPSAQAAASIFDLDCTDLSSQSSFSGLYSPLLGQTILGTT